MPEVYQIKNQSAMYFLTLRVVFWLDAFTHKVYRDILIDLLTFCRKNKGLEVFGYVIMSNQVHLVVRSKKAMLLDTLHDMKKFTACQIIDEIDFLNNCKSEDFCPTQRSQRPC